RAMPYLRELGIEPRLFEPSDSRPWLALERREGLVRRTAGVAYWYGLVLPRRVAQLPGVLSREVVFVQRSMFRYASPPVLERIVRLVVQRVLGRKIVYHC